MRISIPAFALALVLACAGCSSSSESPQATSDPATSAEAPPIEFATGPLNDEAAEFVYLVLSMGEHDADYVDAYFGPPELREQARSENLSMEAIHERAKDLMARLESVAADGARPSQRKASLLKQTDALMARIELLSGESMTFDEESRRLYDAVAPRNDRAYFEAAQTDLAAKLSGDGTLLERYEAYREDFVIPVDKLSAVFDRAIEACREKTAAKMELPEGESFTVEYVNDKPWSGYNYYQGNYKSLIQVNTDLPITIDRAIDLACHEGYPGHHVYGMMIEQELVRERGWPEYTVYPLFSPRSLIAEGTANYGIDMAFPGQARVDFEKEVLFPMAGIDTARADEYYEVQGLVSKLAYAGNEAARGYLDGTMSKEDAVQWLMDFALMGKERATQRIAFIDKYRAYVINYNYGKDLVRNVINAEAGDDEAKRWSMFRELLSNPTMPSDIAER